MRRGAWWVCAGWAVGWTLACAGAGKGDAEDTAVTAENGGNGAGNGGGNSGGNGDSGGNGGDTGDAGPCAAYSGFHAAGSTWDWAYNDEASSNGTDGTWTTTLTTLGADGTWSTTTDGEYTFPGVDRYTSTYTSDGYCDADGVWLTHTRIEYDERVSGTNYSGWSEVTYSSPYLSVPADISEGNVLHVDTTMHVVTSTGGSTDTDVSYTLTVGGGSTVTVPADTFDVMELTYRQGSTTSVSYLAREPGAVSGTSAELVEWNP